VRRLSSMERRFLVLRACQGLRLNLERYQLPSYALLAPEEQAQTLFGIWRWTTDLLECGQGQQADYAFMALQPRVRKALISELSCIEGMRKRRAA